jgi:hypothetical protein
MVNSPLLERTIADNRDHRRCAASEGFYQLPLAASSLRWSIA